MYVCFVSMWTVMLHLSFNLIVLCFQMNNLDPDMRTLFQSVGLTEDNDLDKDTVDFIYDFVEKHGGIDAIRQEIKRAPPPAPPAGESTLH